MKSQDQLDVEAVAAGYDIAGDAYFSYYRSTPSEVVNKYLGQIVDGTVNRGRILELGCGNGLPVTAKLAEKFEVTGVDVSARQIEEARQNVPGAEFIQADMSTLRFPVDSFNGVVAFYSIIHVPRSRQPALIESIYSWTRPAGLFVSTFGSVSEVHRENDWFGSPMYWSSFDSEANSKMVASAGFTLESDVVETSIDPKDSAEKETHQWIVARKPG